MSTRRRSLSFRAALLPFLLCLLAAGCGQKGDLYIPGSTAAHSSASGSS